MGFPKSLAFALTALAVLAVDQASKWWALGALSGGRIIDVAGTFFRLSLTFNTGGSFGIMASHGGFLLFFVIAALVVFACFFRKILAQERIYRIGAALIVGGALGNLVDRLRFGHVVDFLDLRVWPVFNIADSAICAGVFIMALRLIFSRERGSRSCTG